MSASPQLRVLCACYHLKPSVWSLIFGSEFYWHKASLTQATITTDIEGHIDWQSQRTLKSKIKVTLESYSCSASNKDFQHFVSNFFLSSCIISLHFYRLSFALFKSVGNTNRWIWCVTDDEKGDSTYNLSLPLKDSSHPCYRHEKQQM